MALFNEMTLSSNEIATIYAVFSELEAMSYQKLNHFLGSVTIEQMLTLTKKIRLDDWCKEHKVKFEDLNEKGIANAYKEIYNL